MPKYKRGSGSIYLRGKTWWLSYYTPDGQHVCESAKTKDRGQARQLLQQRLGQIAEGRYVGPRADKILIQELAEDMLNDYRINNKKSLDDATRSVTCILQFFVARRAQSLTAADVSHYIA